MFCVPSLCHVHCVYVYTTEFINWIAVTINLSLLTYLYLFQYVVVLNPLLGLVGFEKKAMDKCRRIQFVHNYLVPLKPPALSLCLLKQGYRFLISVTRTFSALSLLIGQSRAIQTSHCWLFDRLAAVRNTIDICKSKDDKYTINVKKAPSFCKRLPFLLSRAELTFLKLNSTKFIKCALCRVIFWNVRSVSSGALVAFLLLNSHPPHLYGIVIDAGSVHTAIYSYRFKLPT